MNIDTPADILVTGGTGLLGKAVRRVLDEQAMPYICSTHSTNPEKNVVRFDLTDGNTIDPNLWGVKVILHLASDKKHPDNDVTGTVSLLYVIKNCKRDIHLIYISIVGTDKISMSYFKQKADTEQKIMLSGVPYSILRATQFYQYLATVFNLLSAIPFISLMPKKVPVQPIDVDIVAERLVRMAKEPATTSIEEIGGGQTMFCKDAAVKMFKEKGKSKLILNIPLWGATGDQLLRGALTSKVRSKSGRSWDEWLKQK